MSDPHDPYRPDLSKPPQEPGPQGYGQPYEQGPSPYPPQQPPWGQVHPGGAPAQWTPQSPYGAHQPAPRDGVSLTGFFVSLTCCLGPLAVLLGLIGLGRTGAGKREGRWAAVSAIVIGALGTLGMVAAVGGGFWLFNNSRLIEETSVGRCYDRFMADSSSVPLLTPQDCDEPHDGEMVALTDQAEVDEVFASLGVDQDEASGAQRREACALLAPERYGDALSSDDVRARFLSDWDNPSGRDVVGCFVESADGQLTTPLTQR
ncbi:DUF4190 domain-containing protein [Nocardioides zeae]|uniref:DUF4190 domain-containing protein n=1 Tax=Nocardioides zeae TaxID=1457234 RepID=A0A6P0HF24_9ACTN|nr:DUF4190 domain-containing protein [Nocardioides zeae]NEN77308.1 DUF4190 domain-containing protein [Nocardioides zeae]